MKRTHCDAFEDAHHPGKVQRIHGQTVVTQRTTPLPQDYNVTSMSPQAPADLRRIMDEFITIYERLDTSDNALIKPNYSYSELVYLALLRSPNFCLPINEIYKYIQHKFLFFRRNTREHWRNAVRHSLSKTKCFTKIGVRRGPNSSGTYNRSMFLWTFHPCSIINFARGDYRSSVDKESGTNTLRWGYYRINAADFWDKVSVTLEQKMEAFKSSLTASSSQSQIFEQQKCILPVPETPNFSYSETRPIYHQAPMHTAPMPTCSNSPVQPRQVQVKQEPEIQQFQSTSFTNMYQSPSHSSVSYRQTSPAYIHGSPSFYTSSYQSKESPAAYGHLLSPPSTPSPSATPSPEMKPDILNCAWNATKNTPTDANSESEFSWNTYNDSGVGTDSSFLKAFIDGRPFHSPAPNVNMFSPSFNTQRYRSCKYSTPNAYHTNSHPHDTFNDVQLLSDAPLSSLLDLAPHEEHDSGVFEFLGNSLVKQDVVSSTASPSCSSSMTSSYTSSCMYDSPSTTPSSSAHAQETACLRPSTFRLEELDFVHDFDVPAIVSIDNLATYSH